jgi:hypothetical protein
MKNIMNQKLSTKAIQRALCMGALLLTATAASAASSTFITFQIDMTVASTNGTFNPATQTINARGMFDGWGTPGFQLTNNPLAANTNLYTGTFDDILDANGALMQYQFAVASNSTILHYSAQVDGNNYIVQLPATSGASLVLPVVFWSEDGPPQVNDVTFQVDMAEQLYLGNFNVTNTVACQGSFEGWSTANFPLTNNPAQNVTNGQGYVTTMPFAGTYQVTNSPGAMAEYKFVYNNGSDHYEAPLHGTPQNSGNRFFFNVPQVLPLVNFSDAPFSNTVTNNVTFIIDMSVQLYTGSFDPVADTIQIFGDYNNWGPGTTMVNTNAGATNLYYTTIQYIAGAGSDVFFKYQINPGGIWENPAASNLIGGNRYYTLAATSGSFTDGPVYFSDAGPSSLIDTISATNCMVTFTVDMSSATNASYTNNNGGPFTIGVDSPYLNGINIDTTETFWTWSYTSPPSQFQMVETPNDNVSPIYTITVPIHQGQPLNVLYKYSIDGGNNEAVDGDNHTRYIRSLPNYTMPTDLFDGQGNGTSSEISFGNFSAAKSGNKVALSWLGRTTVSLQSTTSLNPPIVWTPMPLTDGTNLIVTPGNELQGVAPNGVLGTNVSTNITIGAGSVFYELIGPQ